MRGKITIARAQKVFNAWIRRRDHDKGCISCVTGGVQNAGHYYHGHLYSAVRFNEINCNGQCVFCNLGKAGNSEKYRENLIKKFGEQKVLLLDSAARAKKKLGQRLNYNSLLKNISYDQRNQVL